MHEVDNYSFPEGLTAMSVGIYKDTLSCVIAYSSQYASCAFALQQLVVSHYSAFSVCNRLAW